LRSSSTNATNSTAFTAQAPVGEAAGDVLIAALQLNGTGTVTAPSGFTLIGATSYSGDTTTSYYKVAGSSEPASYTWQTTGYSNGSIAILDYTGIDTTAPVNAWGGNSGAGTALAPAVQTTTTTVSVVLVTWDGGPSSLTVTTPSGYSQRWFLHSYEWTYGADNLSPAAAGTRSSVTVASNPNGVFTAQQLALTLASSTPPPSPTPTPSPSPSASTLQPMPVISRNVPAFSTNGQYPAGWGNDADYGTQYRGTPPTSLIYDLSRVAAAQRSTIWVAWYAESSHWYPPATGDPYYNVPRDYTIDGSAAAGGGQPPADTDLSWTTLARVTGNIYSSQQVRLTFTGYNWLRMRVLTVNGSAGNLDAEFNLDVHDASAGSTDSWAFFGDSITQDDMGHDEPSNFPQQINVPHPNYFPSQIDGGVGGWTAGSPLQVNPTTGNSYWSGFLAATPAHFISVDFGTNDANSGVSPATFKSQMQSLINAVEAAGKVAVVRLIPWGCTSGIQANAPALNQQIQSLWAADPTIIHGPDYWTYFSQNQTLISSDCIHPSHPNGAQAYRTQYANAMLSAIYQGH
jgi:hypothetical protein